MLAQCIPKPNIEEWCIGHLAVLSSSQGLGLASQLVDFMGKLALQQGKIRLTLDVAEDNIKALSLYEHLGFEHQGTRQASVDLQALGVSSHFHLSKSLI